MVTRSSVKPAGINYRSLIIRISFQLVEVSVQHSRQLSWATTDRYPYVVFKNTLASDEDLVPKSKVLCSTFTIEVFGNKFS